MQIQPQTIIWNQPSATSQKLPAREVFRMQKSTDDRMAGSIPVWGAPASPEEKITAGIAQAGADATRDKTPALAAALTESAPAKDDGSYGFLDFVDMINPLQHIPVVSTIYRNLTGDTIKPVSRVVGDTAFGGPIGAATGIVNALVQMQTGKDVGDNMLASIRGETAPAKTPDTTIALANLRAPQPHYNS